ncbi:FAD-dependent monooxygenase [Apiospora kogelbergensis]|uniref:FAD-dependent monooxygenase n=1 Tax=Apiospora kogelbergensis TaxID=1337665 RepID=A0AAW0QR83_9PEZI
MGSIESQPPTQGQVPQHFQIAIVGGGIAGVTLALACERYGLRYALFEARDSLAPADGASIGLQANGLRILDQLGVYDEIERRTAPVKRWAHWDADGKLLCQTDAFSYYRSKFGYASTCLDRQILLEIMSSQLRGSDDGGKDLIKLSCRISSLREDEKQVTITTTDGHVVTADLVVGADGVRSSVRRFIDSQPVDGHSPKADDYMSTRFACVYGISPPMDGIAEGDCFSVYREGAAVLSFTGKGGVVFWFVFEDLGETLPLSRSPRYRAPEQDAEAVCRSVAHLRVAPAVLFGDIYARRTACMKTALEEGIAERWSSGRAVIVGDAAHKMVPNAAQGGNQAMESVALLLNELGSVSGDGALKIPPADALRAALCRYSEQRRARTTKIQSLAGTICRTQMFPHGEQTAAAYQQLPTLSDADWLFRGMMGFLGAPCLNGIPLTERGKLFDETLASFQQRLSTEKYSSKEELVGI